MKKAVHPTHLDYRVKVGLTQRQVGQKKGEKGKKKKIRWPETRSSDRK